MREAALALFHRDHDRARDLLASLESVLASEDAPGREKRLLLTQGLASHLDMHVRREEEALFPVLGRHLPSNRGIVAVSRAEHRAMASIQDRLTRAARRLTLESEDPTSRATLRDDGPRYARLLRDHMSREESDLFPLALERLSEEDLLEVERLLFTLGLHPQPLPAPHPKEGPVHKPKDSPLEGSP